MTTATHPLALALFASLFTAACADRPACSPCGPTPACVGEPSAATASSAAPISAAPSNAVPGAAPAVPESGAPAPQLPAATTTASAREVVFGAAGGRAPEIPQLERTLAALRRRMHGCLASADASVPAPPGSVRLTLRVGPAGEVLSAEASQIVGLGPATVECARSAAGTTRFAAPRGGAALVLIPVRFVD